MFYVTQVIDSEDDVLPLPPPVSLPPSRGNSKEGVPGSRLRKRKINEQNKGSRKRVKTEVKLNLSPTEISHLQNGEMLNDTHIDVANQMLRKQFPEVRGLQSPLLGQSLSFAVTEPPFVQVLHVDTLHWVTVIGVSSSLVKVYDSVFNTAGSSLALQTASILRTKSDNIVLEVERTQFQLGEVEMGFSLHFHLSVWGNQGLSQRRRWRFTVTAECLKVFQRRWWRIAPNAEDGTTNPANQSPMEFLNRTVEMTGFVAIVMSEVFYIN